jgi:1,4-dihydroxy-2-naphthoate octaprenyltransferase
VSRSPFGAYVRHLRLPFQLTLAPIFLWGALLAQAAPGFGSAAAFVSLHLFLYPAATAFNSVFDRDEGPVGGLAAPPPVPAGLARFALILAAAGALIAACVGPLFFLIYALIAGWTAAYSHPATRWKASPYKSAAAIALGQGGLGFLAGLAAAAAVELDPEPLVSGGVSAGLVALGLYPATQVFQVEEDSRRGDRTLAVALGPARALRFGNFCLAVGAASAAWIAARRFGTDEAVLLALGFAALIAAQERLARILPRLGRLGVYREAMRLIRIATTGFLLFLVTQYARGF